MSELAVLAGEAEAPVPLLADGLDDGASSGTFTNLPQTKRPGASIAATPTEVTIVSHHSSFLFSGS